MSSSHLMELIKRQALNTFSKLSSGVSLGFEDNFCKLKNLMNKVTLDDVNLDPSLLLQSSDSNVEKSSGFPVAPVAYLEVLEDPNLTIGIFVLNQGARLPLHDHPLMHGILKVIHGTVLIQSYSVVSSKKKQDRGDETCFSFDDSRTVQPEDIGLSRDTLHKEVTIWARKEPDVLVKSSDGACILSPLEGNLHEIRSVEGSAAFLDILSPPYSSDIPEVGPRPCRYFKEIGDVYLENDQDNRPLKKLVRISSPPDYWSRSAPYEGP